MKKSEDVPHGPRGWLKNNNPPGDLSKAAKCGARNRHGLPCRGPAMKNGRCKNHGGKSTGPKTFDGKYRSQRARLVHGEYAQTTKWLIALSRQKFVHE